MNVIEYPTARWARELPDHPALIYEDKVISYGELERMIAACSQRLRQCEVGPGDRVMICVGNCPEWVIVAHALARIGAVCVPISTRVNASELEKYIRKFSPRTIIVDNQIKPIGKSIVDLATVTSGSGDVSKVTAGIDPDRLHSIILTSGSEGEPKGVCLSFRNHLSSALGSALNLGVHPGDRWLIDLPLDRIGGFAIAMRMAIYGTTAVVHPRFDAQEVWDSVERRHVTQLSCVTTTLKRLLDVRPTTRCPAHVRSVLVGGGPVAKELIDEAHGMGWPVLPTYGLTETSSQIATLSPHAAESKRHTAGHALPLAEIEIRSDAGTLAPVDHPGTIHIRGPMVGMGYWREDTSIDPLIAGGGWFQTRDIGSIDDDGYLFVHGRCDNAIISGGLKIHPEEIEAVLSQHTDVKNVAVIRADDSEWGEIAVAVVEVRPDARIISSDLSDFLAQKLPRHKLPKRIVQVHNLPLLPTGKPDRVSLTALYGK